MDERTLTTGDLQVGSRYCGGILNATVDGEAILVKDAANRARGSLRQCIPTGTDLKREYAAYLVAKTVPNLVSVPAMAWRTYGGQPVIAMEKVRGAHMGYGGLPKGTPMTTKRNLALFDAIIGNTDRHSANYFCQVAAKGFKIVAIDHGLAFPIPDASGMVDLGSSDFLRTEALPQWCVKALQRVLADEAKLRRALTPYLEPIAIDGIFIRVNWMIRKNRFMDYGVLRRYATPAYR
jgi:hypothetical protein